MFGLCFLIFPPVFPYRTHETLSPFIDHTVRMAHAAGPETELGPGPQIVPLSVYIQLLYSPLRPTHFASNPSSPTVVATRSTPPNSRPSSPSSHHADRPSSSSHTALVAHGPRKPGISLDHIFVGKHLYCKLHRNYQFLVSCVSSISLCSTSCSLCRNSLFYYGPLTISDTAPPTPSSSTHSSSRTSLQFRKPCLISDTAHPSPSSSMHPSSRS